MNLSFFLPLLQIVPALVGLYWIAASLGMHENQTVFVALGVGAFINANWPTHRLKIWISTGCAVWFLRNPKFFFYWLGAVSVIYFVRNRRGLVLLFGFLFIFFWPKFIFYVAYRQPAWHSWLDASALAFLFLGGLYYWREKRNERIQPFSFSQWLGYFLFPSNPLNPINMAPSDFADRQQNAIPYRAAWQALGLVACKAAAIKLIHYYGDGFLYKQWPVETFPEKWFGLSRWEIWIMLSFTYIHYALWLSATADVVVCLARFFGLNLFYNYRWALLAWNPVELWRRWAIYNRRLLLKQVYFPLGGRTRHVYRNILLTFLASALILHTGWIGSRYLTVGNDMVWLYSAYFLMQGLAVCVCVEFWHWNGKDPSSDRQLRWSWGRVATTLLTQGYAAWVHLLILCPYGTPWSTRVKAMFYALGF
ncbi:MAG: hypothetical protein K1X66_00120 [Verrucomicrobiae bacterium]|nr:hypothetical protein [Verrucomicrobiae bacterium]